MDLRNYLEQIYKVPVAAVRTRVQHGGYLCWWLQDTALCLLHIVSRLSMRENRHEGLGQSHMGLVSGSLPLVPCLVVH